MSNLRDSGCLIVPEESVDLTTGEHFSGSDTIGNEWRNYGF